ncbi:MAG: hypothetical protein C0594_10570, partial [Marinilabiliales bacterium]
TANITITQPANLTVSVTSNDATCYNECNGDATATPSGGTSPYTYSWDDALFQVVANATGLCDGTYNVVVTDAHSCTVGGSATINEPTEITLTPSSTQANCGVNDGSATITAAGGAGGYSYDWEGTQNGEPNNTITDLFGGSYDVTVSDANGCDVVGTVNVSESGAPTAAITAFTDVVCNGESNGTATVTLTTPTVGDYVYEWSTGNTYTEAATSNMESGLVAGVYSVTITDNDGTGCATNASVIISEPPLLNASINTQTNVNCFGDNTGQATVSVSGGTPAYSYNWSAGGQTNATATGLLAGTHSVTVTDANFCTAIASVTITQPAAALNPQIVVDDVNCFGGSDGSIDLTVTGGTPTYSYVWSNASNNQDLINVSANTYTVTVTDSKSCTATVSGTINEPLAALSIDNIIPTDVDCFNGNDGAVSVDVSGGTPSYTYSWNTGQTTEDLTGVTAGTYELVVTDDNSCVTSASTTVSQPAAALTSGISGTHVKCSGGADGTIDLTVSNGTPTYTYAWSNSETTQDLSALSAGLYEVTVSDANGCQLTNSFTVTEPANGLNLTYTTIDVTCFGLSNGSVNLTVTGGTTPYAYSWDSGQSSQDLINIPAGVYTVDVTDANLCTSQITATVNEPSAALSIDDITVSNVNCYNGADGEVDITVSGGTTAYSYAWNSGQTVEDLTSLTAGTYDIEVTDANGCTTTGSATVTQPAAALTVSAVNTNVSCSGGTDGAIDLTVSNGTPTYTYSWSNSETTQDLSGLSAGIYDVTVSDANGCQLLNSYTITEPANGLNLTYTTIDVTCFGLSNGSVNLSVTGGTTPYSYAWDSGQSSQDLINMSAADYTVTVTDANSCESQITATVNEPTAALSIDNIAITDVNCYNGTDGEIDITVIGGTTAYSYAWNSGQTVEDLTGLSAGIYDIEVTDANGCTTTGSATVTQPAAALSVTVASTNVSCTGGNDGAIDITVSNGTPSYTYAWDSGQTTEDVTGLTAGTYSVVITDANGCNTTISRTITEPANALAASIVSGDVVCNGESTGSIDLSVSGGTPAYSYNWSSGQSGQDLPSVPAGNYTVTVTDAHLCSVIESVVISEPSLLEANIVGTNILCRGDANGSADLTVTGGVASYSYQWNYGQTTEDLSGVTAGAYDVVVTDANGCTASAAINVNQPATAVTASIPIFNITNVECFGGATGQLIVN